LVYSYLFLCDATTVRLHQESGDDGQLLTTAERARFIWPALSLMTSFDVASPHAIS
jgi:hypothetical protein